MTSVINFYLSPLIKVKAKIYRVSQDGSVETEKQKFNINTGNICYNTLRLTLAQVFDITGEFSISYRNKNSDFSLLQCETDLSFALTSAYYCSHLLLVVKSQPLDGFFDEWDIVRPAELPPIHSTETRCSQNRGSIVGTILNHMGKTMVKVTRAFSIDSSDCDFDKSPISETDFCCFLDRDGRLVKPHEFHMAVYRHGIEPSCRPVAWLYLLNVFPDWMTATQKQHYLNSKKKEYCKLRYSWQRVMNEGEASDMLKDIASLVRKDVRRTDRNHKFYSGSDDNKNVQMLFNILTTYAVTHPTVHYCQGMSDLLSPILFVMKDEALAYVAFCGQMTRLERNFRVDGRSIRAKFRHLRKMLYYYDREMFVYLKSEGASSLLFCYRWLVLELKREFEYNDALHVLEVMWGSMPPNAPIHELDLFDDQYCDLNSTTNSISMQRENNNLVWDNDHYSDSSTQQTYEPPRTIKPSDNRKIEYQLKDIAWGVDPYAEVNLPIHYRKRRYRSYTNRKLNRLSMSTRETELAASMVDNTSKFNICQSWACGDDFENHSFRVNTAVVTAREFLRSQWCYSNTVNEIQLNNWLNGKWWESTGTPDKFNDFQSVVETLRQRHGSSDSNYSTNTGNSECLLSDSECRETTNTCESPNLCHKTGGYVSQLAISSKELSVEEGYTSEVDERKNEDDEDEEEEDEDEVEEDEDEDLYSCRLIDSMVGKKYEEAIKYFHRKKELLPPPHSLGDGNPFLLFVCLSMILQHKDTILNKNMDINEICLHFDKLVRKQKLNKTLNSARHLFGEYLNMGWNEDLSDSEDEFAT